MISWLPTFSALILPSWWKHQAHIVITSEYTYNILALHSCKLTPTNKHCLQNKNCTFSQCYELNEIWFCWFINLFRGFISFCITSFLSSSIIWVHWLYMKLINSLAEPFSATMYYHANLSDLTKSLFLCVPLLGIQPS